MIKTTLSVLALATAVLATGNAYAATIRLPVTIEVAPRIKLLPRGTIGCNEISRTIIFNGQAYTATKCR